MDLQQRRNEPHPLHSGEICPQVHMKESTAPIVGQPFDDFATCSGCGHVISDSAFLMVDSRHWHTSCLTCCACSNPLGNSNSCFVKDGEVYCRRDYYRLFQQRSCSHCGLLIGPEDFIIRVSDRLYHATRFCLICTLCHKPLLPGEGFYDHPPGIVCTSCVSEKYEFQTLTDFRNKPGRPRKRKTASPQIESVCSMTNTFIHSDEFRGDSKRNPYPSQKNKRMRTSFRPEQLQAMKSFFNCNHNPDANALKQLSDETHLSKRVLQVWFQNARAKYRRCCAQEAKRHKELTKETKEDESSESTCDQQSPETFAYETSSHSDTSSDYQSIFTSQPSFAQHSCTDLATSLSNAVSPPPLVSSVLDLTQVVSSPCHL